MATRLIGWTVEEYKAWADSHKEAARTTSLRKFVPDETHYNYDSGKPKAYGYASVFNAWYELWSGFRESVAPGAFKKSIAQDDVRALFNHEPSLPLARSNGTLTLREDEKGLYYEFIIPDTTVGRDLLTNMKLGIITQSSFGFNIVEQSLKYDKEKDLVSRTLTEVKLFDVSPVTYPASPQTEVNVRMSVGSADESGELIAVPETGEPFTREQLDAEWEVVRALAIPRKRQ